jgi:hypothetical protein
MKKNQILIILIPSFIFVFAWIGFSIYHNIITSTISTPLSMQITPITPSFDTDTIDALKKRANVIPVYEISTLVQNGNVSASPSANTVTTAPVNPVGNSTETQQATSGGSLTQ